MYYKRWYGRPARHAGLADRPARLFSWGPPPGAPRPDPFGAFLRHQGHLISHPISSFLCMVLCIRFLYILSFQSFVYCLAVFLQNCASHTFYTILSRTWSVLCLWVFTLIWLKARTEWTSGDLGHQWRWRNFSIGVLIWSRMVFWARKQVSTGACWVTN